MPRAHEANNGIDLVLPKPTSASNWVMIAELYERWIEKELKLISDRIGWMITSQSILFGALSLIDLNSNANPGLKNLSTTIPIFALIIILGVLMGVNAAQKALHCLGNTRIKYQKTLETIYSPLPMPRLGSRRANELAGTVPIGDLPFYFVILCLSSLWLVALLVT